MKRIVDLENNRIVGDVVETKEPDWDEYEVVMNQIIKQYEKRAVIEYKEDVKNRIFAGITIVIFAGAFLAIAKLFLISGGLL